VQRKVNGGEIGWLERREPRGQPVPTTGAFKRLGRDPYLERTLFQRLLTPDPNSQLKEIISLDLMKSPFRSKAAEEVCQTVVSGSGGGGGCDPVGMLFGHGPLSVGQLLNDGGDQYETLGGVASDEVQRIELFLATGERIAVPLKDNAFIVQAERSSFPARLVAYDPKGLVIGVDTFRSDAGSTGGPPTVSAKATWRTIIRATSPSGETGTMMIAKKIGGGTCWAFRAEPNGGSQGGCFTKHWKGPALQVSYSEFDTANPRPAFIQGQVRPDVASLAVHLHDGRVLHLKPVDGLVLGPLPKDYKLAGGEYVIGLNRNGKQIARIELFVPPNRA
jgi:hypothetical protein